MCGWMWQAHRHHHPPLCEVGQALAGFGLGGRSDLARVCMWMYFCVQTRFGLMGSCSLCGWLLATLPFSKLARWCCVWASGVSWAVVEPTAIQSGWCVGFGLSCPTAHGNLVAACPRARQACPCEGRQPGALPMPICTPHDAKSV